MSLFDCPLMMGRNCMRENCGMFDIMYGTCSLVAISAKLGYIAEGIEILKETVAKKGR